MRWILYVMLFATPAQNLTKAEKNHEVFESKRIWTLQNTTTMEFSSFEACYGVGKEIEKAVLPVGTMTLRTWCFCDSNAGVLCPDKRALTTQIERGVQAAPPSENKFSIQRLFPPEK